MAEQQKSSTVKILAITCVVLGSLTCCGGLAATYTCGSGFMSMVSGPAEVGHAFLQDLRSGNYQGAYSK